LIHSIAQTPDGYLWIATNKGLVRFDGINFSMVHFAEKEEIASGQTAVPEALYLDTSGKLWIGSSPGLTSYDCETRQFNTFTPAHGLTRGTIRRLTEPIPLPLPANANTFDASTDVRFHFTATTLLSAEKVTFKYRLEGFDEKWTFLAPGKERVARYKNPGPGTYTFKVTACNAEGVWNAEGTAVTFTLKSPFLKSPLFYYLILPLSLAALLAIGFIIYRTNKKQPPGVTITKGDDKESKISLPPGFVKEHTKKLAHLMEMEKAYRDEKLTLLSLAEKLSILRYQLSFILNDHLKNNFNDYINSYRIEEAKKILGNSEAEDKTIGAIAIDVGFNSQTTFYKTFKKYTGMTPNQYRKETLKT